MSKSRRSPAVERVSGRLSPLHLLPFGPDGFDFLHQRLGMLVEGQPAIL